MMCVLNIKSGFYVCIHGCCFALKRSLVFTAWRRCLWKTSYLTFSLLREKSNKTVVKIHVSLDWFVVSCGHKGLAFK